MLRVREERSLPVLCCGVEHRAGSRDKGQIFVLIFGLLFIIVGDLERSFQRGNRAKTALPTLDVSQLPTRGTQGRLELTVGVVSGGAQAGEEAT